MSDKGLQVKPRGSPVLANLVCRPECERPCARSVPLWGLALWSRRTEYEVRVKAEMWIWKPRVTRVASWLSAPSHMRSIAVAHVLDEGWDTGIERVVSSSTALCLDELCHLTCRLSQSGQRYPQVAGGEADTDSSASNLQCRSDRGWNGSECFPPVCFDSTLPFPNASAA